jgi:uncharacterized damage-inducible protein DinB
MRPVADAYFNLLARYNAWANERLYDACALLPEAEVKAPRRAFFGSILATLNHILVGDRIWMSRLAGGDLVLPLNRILHDDLAPLRAAQRGQDKLLVELVGSIPASRLDESLSYRNTKGEAFANPYRLVLGHLFNHQTHHRGQVHDMLSQTAVAPPELDLIYYLRQAAR